VTDGGRKWPAPADLPVPRPQRPPTARTTASHVLQVLTGIGLGLLLTISVITVLTIGIVVPVNGAGPPPLETLLLTSAVWLLVASVASAAGTTLLAAGYWRFGAKPLAAGCLGVVAADLLLAAAMAIG
jgi:hypothetical protein